MALVAKTLTLDITPGAIPQVVNVSEYDENREYTVTLIDEGGVYQIPSGTTATVEGTIGGNAFSESAIVSGNTITFTLSESMTAKAGDVWCKIKLTKDSKPIQTCAFILRCDRAGAEAGAVIGASGFEEQIAEAAGAWLEDQGFTSPTIGVTEITGGHRVTVTDYEGSESFDVMDGEDTGVEVDTTLSVAGDAADAKATGDALKSLGWGEMIPISVAMNSGYLDTQGRYAAPTSNAEEYSDFIRTAPGEKFSFDISFSASHPVWFRVCVYDASKQFISHQAYQGTANVQNIEFTVPNGNAAYLAFTFRTFNDVQEFVAKKSRPVTDKFLELSGVPADAKAAGDAIDENAAVENLIVHSGMISGYISNNSGTIAVASNVSVEKTTDFIAINPNTIYIFKQFFSESITGDAWVAYLFYDSNKSPVGSRYGATQSTELDLFGRRRVVVEVSTTNTSAAYVRVSFRTYGYDCKPMFYRGNKEQSYKQNINDLVTVTQSLPSPVSIKFPFKSINHRGYRENGAPENTIPAYRASKAFGFDFVETDVYETADGAFVCWHDDTITIDGTSKRVTECTLSEIRSVDLGSGEYAGTKVPTFEEFAACCRALDLYPYVELKTLSESGVAQVVGICKNYGILEKTTWISFNVNLLFYVSQAHRMARVGLIGRNGTTAANAAVLKNGVNEVILDTSEMTAARAADCLEKGIGYEVWTLDNASTIIGLPPYCNGVTSDRTIAQKVLSDSYI